MFWLPGPGHCPDSQTPRRLPLSVRTPPLHTLWPLHPAPRSPGTGRPRSARAPATVAAIPPTRRQRTLDPLQGFAPSPDRPRWRSCLLRGTLLARPKAGRPRPRAGRSAPIRKKSAGRSAPIRKPEARRDLSRAPGARTAQRTACAMSAPFQPSYRAPAACGCPRTVPAHHCGREYTATNVHEQDRAAHQRSESRDIRTTQNASSLNRRDPEL